MRGQEGRVSKNVEKKDETKHRERGKKFKVEKEEGSHIGKGGRKTKE